MTCVFCGQRLFGRVMAEPGPAPNHTSPQPRSDSHGGWVEAGRGGVQRFLSLGSDQTRAPGLPGDVTRPTSPFVASPPLFSPPNRCQSCVKCFALLHDGRMCLCPTEAMERNYRSKSRGDKETHKKRASQEVLSQKTTKCTI